MRCVHHGRACGEPPTVITCPEGHRYLVRQLLGKGGFARVFRVAQLPCDAENRTHGSQVLSTNADTSASARGEHGSLNTLAQEKPLTAASCKHYAVKVISRCRLGNSEAGRAALRNEVSIHGVINHPSIVKMRSYWEDQFRIYLLLDLIEGPSLEEFVLSRRRLSEPAAAIYATQIFEAVSYLHKHNFIHRDLKLANILLSKDLCHAYICDFGLAVHVDHLKNPRTPTICGTPNYVAPELLNGGNFGRFTRPFQNSKMSRTPAHSQSSDIWSLGVALFTMLSGSGPFDGEDVPRTLRRIRAARFTFPVGLKLSPNAKSLIRSILTEDYARRPSADEVLCHSFFVACAKMPRAPSSGSSGAAESTVGPRSRISNMSKRRSGGADENKVQAYESTTNQSLTGSEKYLSGRRDLRQRTTPHPVHVTKQGERRSSRNESVPLGRPVNERRRSMGHRQHVRVRRTRQLSMTSGRRGNHLSQVATGAVDEASGISSSSRRSSLIASGMRTDILNLSVTLSAALLRGRKYLDDDKAGFSVTGREERFRSVTTEVDGAKSAPSLVRRWLDYTSKYGFATLMDDGRVGCCFNDGSIMFFVSEPSEVPDVAYLPPSGKKIELNEASRESAAQQLDISKKTCLCALLAEMIVDGGRGSMHDLPSACNISFLTPEEEGSSKGIQKSSNNFKGIAHVRDWARFRKFRATAFRLSNNNVHVKFDVGADFCDDYVFDPTERTLFYREARTGDAFTCFVKDLGEFSAHSEYIYAQLETCALAITRFLE